MNGLALPDRPTPVRRGPVPFRVWPGEFGTGYAFVVPSVGCSAWRQRYLMLVARHSRAVSF
jgi:hypothetical protein